MRTRGAHPLVAKRKIDMNLDRAIFAFAGTMILASLALGHFVSPWWHLLTAFVGLNLLQYSFTGFCPAARPFARPGVRSGCAFKSGARRARRSEERHVGKGCASRGRTGG